MEKVVCSEETVDQAKDEEHRYDETLEYLMHGKYPDGKNGAVS